MLNATSHGDTLNEVVHAYRNGAAATSSRAASSPRSTRHASRRADRHGDPPPAAGALHLERPEGAREPHAGRPRATGGQRVPGRAATTRCSCPLEVDMQDEAGGARAFRAGGCRRRPRRSACGCNTRTSSGAMAHDAQELATAAGALAAAQIGFEGSRRLWRHAGDEVRSARRPCSKDLMLQSRSESSRPAAMPTCSRCRARWACVLHEGGDAYECQSSLLLSDRSGQPLAAPNQWLSTAAVPGVHGRPAQAGPAPGAVAAPAGAGHHAGARAAQAVRPSSSMTEMAGAGPALAGARAGLDRRDRPADRSVRQAVRGSASNSASHAP